MIANNKSFHVLLCLTLFFMGVLSLQRSTLVMIKGKSKGVRVPTATAETNMPRKMKRLIRSIETAEEFQSKVLTPQNDEYLRTKVEGGVHTNLMNQITKASRWLKVTVNPEFGAKPKVTRQTIVETAIASGSFNTLVAAVKAAGLAETLSGGLITVFAPTDEAFAKLEPGTVEALLADIPKLQDVLKNHVVGSSVSSKKVSLLNGQSVETLLGSKLPIKVGKQDGEITIDSSAKVTQKDVKCSNGYIHIIDTVLVPK